MEGALVSLAIKAGHEATAVRASFPRLDEIPFDSRHRYMATLHAGTMQPPVVAYVKGAPERILAMCSHVATRDGGTRAVLAGVAAVVGAQIAFTYLPPMQAVFGSRPVSLGDGMAIIAVGVALLAIVEVEKRLAAAWDARHA